MSKVQAGYKSTELGGIPEDWEIVSLADVADPNKPYALTGGPFGSDLKSEEYTESGVRIIQLQNIKEGYFSNKYKIYTSEAKANQLFKCNIFPNDIIIAKMAEPVARACIIPNLHERYLMASDGIRLAVNEEDYCTKYVMYAINSSYFRQQAIDNSTGTTRLRIGLKTLKRLKFLKPSKEEQQKIATILSTVDKDIEKTETIIEQTEKVKKGLMQQLLTKGIGHTKFKRTEIGEIPVEWEVKRLDEIASFISNGFVGVASPYYSEEIDAIPYLMSNNVRANKLDLRKLTRVKKEFNDEFVKSILQEGDLLTVQSGHIGTTAVVPKEFERANCHALIITRVSDNGINPYFVSYFLNSVVGMNLLKKIFVGSTILHINTKDFKKFKVPIPNLIEQQRIVDALNSIEDKIQNEQGKLTQLQILKKGLMQSLLTGNIRVKGDEAEVTQV
ncbi:MULTISPECIES: restriction endonuclease subunit S [unclassified Bacillus cereus group]|uniref:restriction endonuclease subunit S n=1 Tax=unclassified Bacillus cereus group TaxID=2750818 RepID=UPI0022DFE619|nr:MULTISPECIES: restriction endonuclease subunit S [unclassified Bacillus cereus group]MDA2144882.1 restriction endonuclease subunit S [Bacillus cereus group sp. Bc248]MDA2172927.1 restriction endonuclease subunit S [Bacillus cereus group sp. Bc247]